MEMAKVLCFLRMKRTTAGLMLFVSLAAFVVLLRVSWEQAAVVEWKINWLSLALACVVYFSGLGVSAFGWHLISSDLALGKSFRTNARIYALSNAARRLPGGIWGIGSRIYLYRLEGFSELVTSLAIAVEAAVVALSVLIAMLMLVPFAPLPEMVRSHVIALAAVGVVLVVCLHPRVLRWALNRLTSFFSKQQESSANTIATWRVLLWVGTYVIAWGIGGVLTYLVLRSLYPVPVAMLPAVMGAWFVTGAISLVVYVAPSGFGITELSLVAILSNWVPLPVATAAALAMRLFTTACEIAWALVLVRWR
ncbi:MAG: flippase-like domain-containing protein [Chloroflexi bacterium]|nr:flippase-like domain-containing protein [Chloroflexota bacterium]